MTIIRYAPTPPVLDSSLKVAWTPKIINGSVIDISGNNKNGTITNGCSFENDPCFGSSFVTLGNESGFSFTSPTLTTSVTFGFWLKTPILYIPTSTLQMIMASNTDYLGLQSGGGVNYLSTRLNIGGTNRYNSISTYTNRIGVWTLYVITYDGDVVRIFVDDILGTTSTSYSGGSLSNWAGGPGFISKYGSPTYSLYGNVRSPFILNRAMTHKEVIDYYNLSRAACWKTDYGALSTITAEGGTVGGFLSNTPFQFGDTTGRFYVETDTINGKLCKVIRCSTAGILYIDKAHLQQEDGAAAFGEWEFYVYHVTTSNTYFCTLSLSTTDLTGYTCDISNTEYFAFYRLNSAGGVVATIMQTAASYVPINTWVKFTISRNVAGSWYVKMDDKPITVSTGTNPATEATNLTVFGIRMGLGAGDKISLGAIDGSNAIVKGLKA